ncbi:MAG: hypothetical protein NXH85_05535 [Pseudomonadaceae bacterium]|nr:hypothetical protein [Pseudomonadaceae bacterium]
MSRYLLRFLLLIVATALITVGLLLWQSTGFTLQRLLELNHPWIIHPVVILTVGLAMLPVTLWELLLLQIATEQREDENNTATSEPNSQRHTSR